MSDRPFLGRTIQVVRDLSTDEQVYLYDKTRELKSALTCGSSAALDAWRVNDPDIGVYLMFLEDSTRTKESFRNAVSFHRLKANDFSVAGSSFSKKESITDTVRMLVGYSRQSVFVVRSKTEGTCRWLERAIGEYAARYGLAPTSFINAGDGRHEHPTQEFLDEFSFLEQLGWDRSHIHVALVGDLFHGRTVHSKVDGLRVFSQVAVDLVAPAEITMPEHYVRAMQESGFEVRTFETIDEYLSQPKVAPVWYFTRLQLERMGEKLLDRADALRSAVTFQPRQLPRVADGTRFYHPLPRHQVTPTIPTFLDATALNGWDRQAMNGYYTRIVELAMVTGFLGSDFEGERYTAPSFEDDFVVEVPARSRRKPDYRIGIKPVSDGIVIDHIGKGRSPAEIWDQIDKIRRILGLNTTGSHGVFDSESGVPKGIISLPGVRTLDEREIKMLGASAPGCTLNMIEGGEIRRKLRMAMPPRVYNLPGICCRNEDCISHPSQHEPVVPEFLRSGNDVYSCKYCERPHRFSEIW